jgi:hypothetical protein
MTDGSIFSVAIDPRTPNVIYAGASSKAYVSLNSGLVWQDVGDGLPTNIQVLVITPVTSPAVYVGTWGNGIYKSERAYEFVYLPIVIDNIPSK